MGQYGTATGIIRYSDPTTGEGSLLVLKEGELLAEMNGNYLRMGAAAGEHVYIDSDEVSIRDGADTLVILSGSSLILGDSSGQHVYIDSDEVSIKDGADAIITLSAVGSITVNPTAGGTITIGSGWAALPTGASTVALGVEAGDGATGTNLVAIGTQAGQGSSGTYGIHLGTMAGENNSGNYGLFGGWSAGKDNSGLKAIHLGHEAGYGNTGDLTLGVGYRAAYENDGDRVIAIGTDAGSSTAFDDTISIGHAAVPTAANQMVIGSTTQILSDVYVGRGVRSGAGLGNPITIHATGALLLDDTEGHALVLAGGKSTGSAAGGSVVLATAPAGTTGDAENELVDRLVVNSAGLVAINAPSPTTSYLHVNGSLAMPYSSVITDYTATIDDYTIGVECSSADITITLPTAASAQGRIYHIKKLDNSGYNVIIDGDGSETIDGSTTAVLSGQYDTLQIQSTGFEWLII